MEISIHLINENDAEKLFEFEVENRAFFEKTVPSRGEDYYSWEIFSNKHRKLLKEQENGESHFYLVKDADANIIGRVNLVDIDKTNGSAELGFRIRHSHTGQGIGCRAVNILLTGDALFKKIHAKTATVNIASQKVLKKNGFIQHRIDHKEFEMNGEKMKFIYFSWEKSNIK